MQFDGALLEKLKNIRYLHGDYRLTPIIEISGMTAQLIHLKLMLRIEFLS